MNQNQKRARWMGIVLVACFLLGSLWDRRNLHREIRILRQKADGIESFLGKVSEIESEIEIESIPGKVLATETKVEEVERRMEEVARRVEEVERRMYDVERHQ